MATKDSSEVIVGLGTLSLDQALQRARELDPGRKAAMVVGIVRHPNTPCWWVCIARCGRDVRWVSAHRLRREAEAQVMRVQRAVGQGALWDDGVFVQLLNQLMAEGDPALQHTLALAPDGSRGDEQPSFTGSLRLMHVDEPGAAARRAKATRRSEHAGAAGDGDGGDAPA